jgi:hypothetical protein
VVKAETQRIITPINAVVMATEFCMSTNIAGNVNSGSRLVPNGWDDDLCTPRGERGATLATRNSAVTRSRIIAKSTIRPRENGTHAPPSAVVAAVEARLMSIGVGRYHTVTRSTFMIRSHHYAVATLKWIPMVRRNARVQIVI